MRRVVLLSFIWGWSFLLIKVALRGMTPATVAFARIFLGMLVMLIICRVKGVRMPADLSAWRHFAVMGLAYSAVPFTLLAWGEQHITSALAAVVNATTGLFTALFAAIGLGERLRRTQIAGLLIGLGGVAVAAGLSARDLRSSSGAGVLAVLAVSASYGLAFVYARIHLTGTPPLVAAVGQLVAGAVLALPLALVTTALDGFSPSPREFLAVALLGGFGTGIAYVINYRSIAEIGATKASLVTYLVPVVAVALGVLFLEEDFHVRLVLGGALVVAGVALVQDRFQRLRASGVPPAAAALLLVALMAACGGSGSGGGAPAGGCGADTRELLDPGSLTHLLPGAPEPTYSTDPPTSGPHLAGATVAGVQDDPLPRPVQVAVLEAGGVVIQHTGDLSSGDLRRLRRLATRSVVVAPNPGLDDPVVATAWRHRLVCGSASGAALDALETFVEAHEGKGPEQD